MDFSGPACSVEPPYTREFRAFLRRFSELGDSLAEGVGFEFTSDFRRCRFSNALLSVTLRARQCQRVLFGSGFRLTICRLVLPRIGPCQPVLWQKISNLVAGDQCKALAPDAHDFTSPACGAPFCWRRASRRARLASALVLRRASLTLRSMFMLPIVGCGRTVWKPTRFGNAQVLDLTAPSA